MITTTVGYILIVLLILGVVIYAVGSGEEFVNMENEDERK